MSLKPVINPITGQIDMVQDVSGFERLDGTNQPSTASKSIVAVTPETRLTTSANSRYSRLVRTAPDTLELKNQVAGADTNKSLQLNGSSQYVSIPYNASLNLTGDSTISAWVKVTQWNSGGHYLLTVYGGGYDGTNEGLGIRMTSSFLDFFSFNNTGGNTGIYNTSNPLSLNVWYHLCGTYDSSLGSNQWKLYIDGGSPFAQATSIAPYSCATVKSIGSEWIFSSFDMNRNFIGIIEDVRVYNRALLQSEVTVLASGGDPSSTGLVSHWKVNEIADPCLDTQGTNNGTYVGSPIHSTDIPSEHPGYDPIVNVETNTLSSDASAETFGNSSKPTAIIGTTVGVTGNTTVTGTVHVTGTSTLDGTTQMGSGTSLANFIATWYAGKGFWINIPTDGASGIGTGGAGDTPWIAYAYDIGNWFSNSITGDICYRSGTRILWGNTSGNAGLSLVSDKFGIGVTPATASLHIKAGTTSANTAPIKLTDGTLNTTPEDGALERTGSKLKFTDSTPTRRTLAYEEKTISTKTLSYPLTTSDEIIIMNGTSLTATLPTAVGNTGRIFTIKNIHTTNLTIACTASETIDGSTTQTLGQWDTMVVTSDGSQYLII